MEKVSLTVPVYKDNGVTEFRPASIYLKRFPAPAELRIILGEVDAAGSFVENGRSLNLTYAGAEAVTLLRQLNTANLSLISLERRVMIRLQADGKLGAGAISGVPD